MILQPILQKFIGEQQKNQDQEEELGACAGSAFEIKDDITREESSETKLHRPWKVRFELLNPIGRSGAALPSQSEGDHNADNDQVKKQKDIIDQVVDTGQCQ